jgi:hypothetical protein
VSCNSFTSPCTDTSGAVEAASQCSGDGNPRCLRSLIEVDFHLQCRAEMRVPPPHAHTYTQTEHPAYEVTHVGRSVPATLPAGGQRPTARQSGEQEQVRPPENAPESTHTNAHSRSVHSVVAISMKGETNVSETQNINGGGVKLRPYSTVLHTRPQFMVRQHGPLTSARAAAWACSCRAAWACACCSWTCSC